MTKQKILDTIDREFKGKATSLNQYGRETCLYLTDDGKKCAIGLFIPDGHESQKQKCTVRTLLDIYPDLWEYMPSNCVDILEAFQRFHDSLDSFSIVEQQKKKLIDFVEQHF